MRSLFAYFLIVALIDRAFTETAELDCSDTSTSIIGQVFHYFKSDTGHYVDAKFFLSTKSAKTQVYFDVNDWSGIESAGFDPFKKTVFIIHGYASNGKKPWVTEMTHSILYHMDVNVIAVDWSNSSSSWNYVNTARHTQRASRKIFEFLQTIKSHKGAVVKGHKWNILYFIGHSLGSHISGQTAHLLKQDSFWKVERITGLDPAQPCFINVDSSLKIDKAHADFVDIIHTQGGKRDNNEAFGLNAVLGHVDFYVNGGLLQPACSDTYITLNAMICSHKIATEYFIETIDNEMMNLCTFDSSAWDGTYADAERLLELKKKGEICQKCPKMGIEASKSSARGKFIVFTSSSLLYCKFNLVDYDKIKKVLENLQANK
ncbi:pancreatic triacylglycerol lipase [Nasonia vitripennis]|uniref:phospholipase A1 n=1 Tax=Nasonia vitripennis TaxID=7425 RepID=A0A7M7LNX3_NASVI|nr:pancreatic triacylglycerol lipase [Nasonia vitripennis]